MANRAPRRNVETEVDDDGFFDWVSSKIIGSGLVICLSSMLVSANGETPKNRICRCAVSCDLSRRWPGRYLSG